MNYLCLKRPDAQTRWGGLCVCLRCFLDASVFQARPSRRRSCRTGTHWSDYISLLIWKRCDHKEGCQACTACPQYPDSYKKKLIYGWMTSENFICNQHKYSWNDWGEPLFLLIFKLMLALRKWLWRKQFLIFRLYFPLYEYTVKKKKKGCGK